MKKKLAARFRARAPMDPAPSNESFFHEISRSRAKHLCGIQLQILKVKRDLLYYNFIYSRYLFLIFFKLLEDSKIFDKFSNWKFL